MHLLMHKQQGGVETSRQISEQTRCIYIYIYIHIYIHINIYIHICICTNDSQRQRPADTSVSNRVESCAPSASTGTWCVAPDSLARLSSKRSDASSSSKTCSTSLHHVLHCLSGLSCVTLVPLSLHICVPLAFPLPPPRHPLASLSHKTYVRLACLPYPSRVPLLSLSQGSCLPFTSPSRRTRITLASLSHPSHVPLA